MIGTTEAAERLGVSPRRLRALVASGRLPARTVGGRWLIDEADLHQAGAREPVRPLGPRLTGALLAVLSGEDPGPLRPAERARLHTYLDRLATHWEPALLLSAWLRHRTEALRLSIAPADVPALSRDPRVVPSGISAPRSGMGGSGDFEGWVHREDLDSVRDDFLLVTGHRSNLWLRVTNSPVPRPVPRGWMIADLADWSPSPREIGQVRRLIDEFFHPPARRPQWW